MSKEVKRYVMRASGHEGVMPVNEHYTGRDRQYVLASDYDALLAERDRLKSELAELVRIVGMSVDGSSARHKAMEKAFAALQGEQL